MKPTIVLLGVVLAGAAGMRADAATADVATPALEKELIATMAAVAEAVGKRDVAALQRLLHDELVYSHSDARSQSKTDLLNEAKEGKGPGNVNILDAKVHVYGTTAVIRGRAGTPPRPIQANSPYATAVFVKSAAGWQLVARTATRAPDPGAGRSGR
jgi:ketosteroid isomerase-like protein